jgi:hypothetical protein
LVNIRAAREVCTPTTPQCVADLDTLEVEARGALGRANNQARTFNDLNTGSFVLPIDAPY